MRASGRLLYWSEPAQVACCRWYKAGEDVRVNFNGLLLFAVLRTVLAGRIEVQGMLHRESCISQVIISQCPEFMLCHRALSTTMLYFKEDVLHWGSYTEGCGVRDGVSSCAPCPHSLTQCASSTAKLTRLPDSCTPWTWHQWALNPARHSGSGFLRVCWHISLMKICELTHCRFFCILRVVRKAGILSDGG